MEENDTVYGCILNLFKAKNAVVSGSVLFPTPVIVSFSVLLSEILLNEIQSEATVD